MGPPPVRIPTLLSFLFLCHTCTSFRPQVVERSSDPELPQSSGNTSGSGKRMCLDVVVCKPGILLPVWLPLNPPLGEQAGRAVIYFLCLMYMFVGVSVIADRFMASIEVITSQVLLILNLEIIKCSHLFSCCLRFVFTWSQLTSVLASFYPQFVNSSIILLSQKYHIAARLKRTSSTGRVS